MSADTDLISPAKEPRAGLPAGGRPSAWALPLTWMRAWGARFWLGALFFVAYLLADLVNLFPHARFGVQPWNPQPAVALALIAYGGSAYGPVVLAAILVAWFIAPGLHPGLESVLAGVGVAVK